MKTNKSVVMLTGLGSLAPVIAFIAAILGLGFVVSICKLAFSITWVFMLVHVLMQKSMEGSSKVGWFVGLFLFGFLLAPFYWYFQIRDAQKWSRLGRSW